MTIKERLEGIKKEVSFKSPQGYYVEVGKIRGIERLTNSGFCWGENFSIEVGFRSDDYSDKFTHHNKFVSTSFEWYNGKPIVDRREFYINKKQKKLIFDLLDKAGV